MDKSKLDFFDKLILKINPEWGLRRIENKYLADYLTQAYDLGSKADHLRSWIPSDENVNNPVLDQGSLMSGRAKDLYRNDPKAKRIINLYVKNIVGKGFKHEVNSVRNPDFASEYETFIKNWTKTPSECDVLGRSTFKTQCRIMVRTTTVSGETFIIRTPYVNPLTGKATVKLKLLDSHFCPIELDQVQDQNLVKSGEEVLGGLIFDQGSPVVKAYLFYKQDPLLKNRWLGNDIRYGLPELVRVDAKDVIHMYSMDFASLMRGVTWLHAIGLKLKDLGEYDYATIVRAKIAATRVTYRESQNAENAVNKITGTSSRGYKTKDRRPGEEVVLSPGEKVYTVDSPADRNYKDFKEEGYRELSAGSGIPEQFISGNYRGVNFSSMVAITGDFLGDVQAWQEELFIDYALPIINNWLFEAFLINKKMSKSSVPEDLDVIWSASIATIKDPIKASESDSLEIRNGFASWKEKVRARGKDPEKLAKEIAESQELFDKHGLKLDCDGRIMAKSGMTQPDKVAEKNNEDNADDENVNDSEDDDNED